jgi:hypothetical protein
VSTYIVRDVELDVDVIETAVGRFEFGGGIEFEGAGL